MHEVIDLYSAHTPNGQKIGILLEELNLEYQLHLIDLSKGEQKLDSFLAINPNGKIPALVDEPDSEGNRTTLFESGAIMLYLAEKHNRFIPDAKKQRWEAIQWLMFQMGNVGPIFGQAFHFSTKAPEPIPYAIERYLKETSRLLEVLDKRIKKESFLAGEYSIADMATYPWVWAAFRKWSDELGSFPHLHQWMETISKRPAVQKGVRITKSP